MRFLADGPSIPVELLEQRDRGNVVFFCGAGVSKPAGLPSFSELAKRVMTALGTDAGSKSRILLEQGDGAENLDRVFNLLYQEFRRDEVDRVVNRILRTPRRANTSAHATILRLSRSSAGRPQVVRPISITFSNAWTSLCKCTSAPACQISGVSARSKAWCTCTAGGGIPEAQAVVPARG
jgi:hypothetical protein